MRLDHLLSKEQLDGESRPVARTARLWWWGAHRRRHWRVSYRQRPAVLVQLLLFRGVSARNGNRWCGWWKAISTLLGPERTTAGLRTGGCCFRTVQAWPGLAYRPGEPASGKGVVFLGVWCGVVGVVGWLLVENCTVDASILFSVVKLSRANGGCLGTRSR